ncbi:ANTAR domain-containing protein [uncultured Jatrophihabitans sp.]|uniref:ANTAR domain-containing protein n=1 Tax=uncultured Jatrophihabitans sp. TaxID=1610747 RepID=UPI0035C9824D
MTLEQTQADAAVERFVSERDLLTECQGELQFVNEELEHLRAALVSARRIGAAIGILMGQRHISDDAAFALLSDASQRTNRKLRHVADYVRRTGTLDGL